MSTFGMMTMEKDWNNTNF